MALIRFIFGSFWTFCGVAALLVLLTSCLETIIKTAASSRDRRLKVQIVKMRYGSTIEVKNAGAKDIAEIMREAGIEAPSSYPENGKAERKEWKI